MTKPKTKVAAAAPVNPLRQKLVEYMIRQTAAMFPTPDAADSAFAEDAKNKRIIAAINAFDRTYRKNIAGFAEALTGVKFSTMYDKGSDGWFKWIKGGVLVLVANPNGADYPLGEPVLLHATDNDTAYNLRGVLGNHIQAPQSPEHRGWTRPATEEEINAYIDTVGVDRVADILGVVVL